MNLNPEKEKEKETRVTHFPEHGPLDENGKEVLLSLKNVNIDFRNGDKTVHVVKAIPHNAKKGNTLLT